MEEENAVRRLALVLAVQAEIEAMKIHNLISPNNPYLPRDFNVKAEELRNLAYAHTEQLFG